MTIPQKTVDIIGIAKINNIVGLPDSDNGYTVTADDLDHLLVLEYRLLHGQALDIEEYSAWAKVVRRIVLCSLGNEVERPSVEGSP